MYLQLKMIAFMNYMLKYTSFSMLNGKWTLRFWRVLNSVRVELVYICTAIWLFNDQTGGKHTIKKNTTVVLSSVTQV